MTYVSMTPLVPCAPLQKEGPHRNDSGQANKINSNHPGSQIPCLREPLDEVRDYPLKTFSRQFPGLG